MSESSLSNQEKEEDRPIKECRPSIDRLFMITWIVLSWTVLAWMFGMRITASGGLLEMGEAFVVLWALTEVVLF